ncbi:anti-sigma factor antagonist [Actinomadura madurae]|uniref:anti-sigma factor antagonist n=1 Tax=Actinomadura madurae TaxID=1993 RepID=UPI002025E00E|nr:anti-sigma factor antagonist [Actinomadura madurae]URN01144.1 anti-sigma factor antagonist [Actinomadura madurae]
MEILRTSTRTRDIFTVVSLSGELDHSNSHMAGVACQQALDSSDEPHLILDLAELAFMDSSGLAVLMRAYQISAALQGTIALAGASERIERTLSIAGLTGIIPTYATVDAAIAVQF